MPTLRELIASESLERDEEQALARSARDGDSDARSELIQSSLRLVALRLRNLRVPERDADDAFQAGSIGLIAAIDGFDPDAGVRLATYAWPWITAAIRSTMVVRPEAGLPPPDPASPVRGDLESVVQRLPRTLANVVAVRFRLGEAPDLPRTHADVAGRLGLSVGQVRRAEKQALGMLRQSLATLGDRDPL